MGKTLYRVSPEVKADILKRIKEQGIPVSQVAQEHGVSTKTIYTWLGKGVEGQPTIGELVKLKWEDIQWMQEM